jgi:hypothetical protein
VSEPTILWITIDIPEQDRTEEVRFFTIKSGWSDGETRTYKAGTSIRDWTRNEIVKHLDAALQAVNDAQLDHSE